MTYITYLDYILNKIKSGKYKIILPKMKEEYQYHYYLIVAYTDEPPEMKFFEYKTEYDNKPIILDLDLYGFKHAEITAIYFAMNEYNWSLIDCIKEVVKGYYQGTIGSRLMGIKECKREYLDS